MSIARRRSGEPLVFPLRNVIRLQVVGDSFPADPVERRAADWRRFMTNYTISADGTPEIVMPSQARVFIVPRDGQHVLLIAPLNPMPWARSVARWSAPVFTAFAFQFDSLANEPVRAQIAQTLVNNEAPGQQSTFSQDLQIYLGLSERDARHILDLETYQQEVGSGLVGSTAITRDIDDGDNRVSLHDITDSRIRLGLVNIPLFVNDFERGDPLAAAESKARVFQSWYWLHAHEYLLRLQDSGAFADGAPRLERDGRDDYLRIWYERREHDSGDEPEVVSAYGGLQRVHIYRPPVAEWYRASPTLSLEIPPVPPELLVNSGGHPVTVVRAAPVEGSWRVTWPEDTDAGRAPGRLVGGTEDAQTLSIYGFAAVAIGLGDHLAEMIPFKASPRRERPGVRIYGSGDRIPLLEDRLGAFRSAFAAYDEYMRDDDNAQKLELARQLRFLTDHSGDSGELEDRVQPALSAFEAEHGEEFDRLKEATEALADAFDEELFRQLPATMNEENAEHHTLLVAEACQALGATDEGRARLDTLLSGTIIRGEGATGSHVRSFVKLVWGTYNTARGELARILVASAQVELYRQLRALAPGSWDQAAAIRRLHAEVKVLFDDLDYVHVTDLRGSEGRLTFRFEPYSPSAEEERRALSNLAHARRTTINRAIGTLNVIGDVLFVVWDGVEFAKDPSSSKFRSFTQSLVGFTKNAYDIYATSLEIRGDDVLRLRARSHQFPDAFTAIGTVFTTLSVGDLLVQINRARIGGAREQAAWLSVSLAVTTTAFVTEAVFAGLGGAAVLGPVGLAVGIGLAAAGFLVGIIVTATAPSELEQAFEYSAFGDGYSRLPSEDDDMQYKPWHGNLSLQIATFNGYVYGFDEPVYRLHEGLPDRQILIEFTPHELSPGSVIVLTFSNTIWGGFMLPDFDPGDPVPLQTTRHGLELNWRTAPANGGRQRVYIYHDVSGDAPESVTITVTPAPSPASVLAELEDLDREPTTRSVAYRYATDMPALMQAVGDGLASSVRVTLPLSSGE